ncbi:MAG: YitT family protein [Paludibacteraceae bacterium]|nr:YitT family protein [Paludibacteraceae bacterium]
MNSKKDYLKSFYWKDYIMIFAGLILYAVGLTGFLLPNKIVTGGLAGVTVLIKSATEIPLWVSYVSINAVLLIFAWKIVGKNFVIKTVVSVAVLTILLRYGEFYITKPIIHADALLSSMIGAMFCGAGLGLVYSVNGSTGGTDIIGAVVTKYRHVSMGRVLLLVDILIVASSFFLFRSVEKIAIGLIVMAVMYYAVDVMISGMRQSVQFFIFTSKYDEVASHINSEIKRGCTIIDGMGWYSKKSQKIIIVLARKTESTSIFRLVKSIDQDAFVTQANVVGVYGKGFDVLK